MAEGYQEFLDFDWSDERWQSYLQNLYPPPNQRQLLKFKKKWYKKNVDPGFDDTYEVPTPGAGNLGSSGAEAAASGGAKPSSAQAPALPNAAFADGTRWAVMGKKGSICFVAYAISLVMAVGSMAAVFPAYRALLLLVSSFLLELFAKYGLKFKPEYLHCVLLDDVGVMPIMALTMLMPGLHPAIRAFALGPFFFTGVLSFAQICKNHIGLPLWIYDFFAPLASACARYRLMQARGHWEVALGFVLIIGVFTARAAPFAVLLFWNFMMMRYMMSSWVQASFQQIDDTLNPVLGKMPGIKFAYAALKRNLYSFVDPESRRAGRLCTIL